MAEITSGVQGTAAITTADGRPLAVALRHAERVKRWKAFLLVLPLLFFLGATFLYPIALMLFRSVENPVVADNLPRTLEALESWDARDLPDEAVFAALAADLGEARKNKTFGRLATRINQELSGTRTMIMRTARRVARFEAPFKDAVTAAHPGWSRLETWAAIARLGNRYTAVQYLAAVDLRYDVQGDIVAQPENRQIYRNLFLRTLWMSVVVTLACLALGYPIAYLLASLPARYGNLLMILVLLPFWTSLLVRTTSWIVLLQTQGVLNDLLVWLGIIGDDQRIQMIFNAQGTVVAMTQILLPFMILPLYSVMKTIPDSYMRAAQSLGAQRFYAYWRVYVPNTLPGIGAGCLLVFILAIGYYITPALVGGEDGQMISNLIAFHMQKSLNWSLAAALGGILLAGVIVLYWLYNRLVGVERLKLG